MTKKKKLILEAARVLFNEKGYHQVTIRMIALKLGMSSGNLNYHYKKREDIFEALYFEMVSEFDERVSNLAETKISLGQIRNDIDRSMRRMVDYNFFWTDLYNLLNVSDKVKKHFQEVYRNRINGCFLLFTKMINEDLMREPSFKLEHSLLAERMVNHGNTWLYSTRLYIENFNTEEGINYQVDLLLSMFFPFLTSIGEEEFKKVLPSLFD